MYKNLFFDLDDTLWAFSENAYDTFLEMYEKHRYSRFFHSFSHFYGLYQQRNSELWVEYAAGKVTKDELNRQRFFYPLQAVGIEDALLAKQFSEDFFAVIPTKSKLMPHAGEVLDYLHGRGYNLYILSNGFRELQRRKMQSAGIARYFRDIFVSERLGADKPSRAFFQACFDAIPDFDPAAAIVVGDSLTSDIRGARNAGLRSCWYDPGDLPPRPDIVPDHIIRDLRELPPLLERLWET